MANLLSTTVSGQLNTGNVIDLGYTVNGSISTTAFRGINFHSFSDYNYLIGKRAGAWTQPLDITFYTGIRYHAHQAYGGHKFYTGGFDSNFAFSIGDGDANVRIANTLIFSSSNATMISNASMTDAIGYNTSYGTYIGSTVGGTYYIYGNGRFYDNGTIRTLIHSGNIGSQNVGSVQGYSAYSLIEGSRGTHSGSDFPNGTLVTTDINASEWAGASFVMEVSGKSYSSHSPFKLIMQGYLYADTVINVSAMSYGSYFPSPVKVMNLDGNLAFWWPRGSYWNSFEVHVRDADGSSWNRVTGIGNSVDPPEATKKVSCTPIQVIHTNNIGSQSVSYASSSGSATTATNLGADYTADDWFRATADNNPVKFYGNSYQITWRTDGASEAYSGIGAYPFVWTYGGSSASNRRMLMDTSGNLWTNTYGWLHDYFQIASTAITTSNIGSQSVNYATTAGSAPANGGTSTHTYRGIIEDTRDGQRTPNAYDDYRVSWEFTNQMPHDSNWLTIMTMQGWHDGYAAWQIMGTATTTALENWYLRSGVNGTWNAARTIIHSGNIGSQSVSYATSAGSAGTAGSAGSVDGLTINNSGAPINPDSVTQNQIGYNTSVSLFGQTDGGLYSSAYSSSWIHQIYGDFRTGQIAIRGKNANTWGDWRIVVDDRNIASYAVPYGNMTSSTGLNDNKLYLRTNGDNNHYLWNAADDWEELVYYTGTGFRVKGSTGTVSATFTDSGISIGTSSTLIRSFDAQGYLRIYGSSTNFLGIGPYNNNGWVYFENSGNSNGIYFNSQGRYAFDSVDVTPYTDNENSLGNGSYRWANIYTGGWLRNYGAQGMYNESYGTHFYSNSGGAWAITGSGGAVELQFRSNHQSTLRGYVYADTSNNIGFLNDGGSWSLRMSSTRNAEIFGSDLTIGAGGANATNIIMGDNDEGSRTIHCNSNRIGFLNQSAGWGAWNDDNGNWGMSLNAYMGGNRFDIQGAEGQISFKDADNVWTGYVGFSGNLGYLSFPGRNVKINSGYNGTITLETGVSGYNSGVVSIPYGRLTVDNSYIYAGTYIQAGSDMRAPIFYDSQDTTFYVDPNSSSRLRNLYVGDSGSNWSDTGGWGTQFHLSNGPHSIIRVYARNEGIETVMFSHVGGQSKVGSGTNHDFAIVRNFSDRMTFYSGYTYANGYLQAADSLRAPIFYDSQDTTYYGDFASLSRVNEIGANKMRADTNGDYGTDRGWWSHDPYGQGWGKPHGSFRSLEVSTSGNFDTEPAMFRIHQWGSGAAEFWKPKGTTLYLRETPGGSSSWFTRFEVQGSTYVTSSMQAYSYQGHSNVAGTGNASYHPSGIYSIGTNWLYGTMYMNDNSIRDVKEVYNNGWFRTVGHQGIYNPTNDAHFYPNNASYGSWRIDGTRNGWHGLHFSSGATLMMNGAESGVHREGVGWQWRWDAGTLHCHKGATGGGVDATVLDSVNYTNYAAAASGNTGNEFGARSFFFPATTFNPSTAPRDGLSSMSVKMWNNYFNGTGLGSDYGTVMEYYSLSGHVDSQVYFDAGGGSWYRSASYAAGWQGWQQYITSANFTTWAQEKENQRLSTTSDVTHNSTTSPLFLVNGHSDNTKGYRIHNTSGSSVSAMFVNSSNALVIAAGAVDQVNLNKKVYLNGVALGVNFAPSATAGRIDASNDIVAFNSSDERLKENITPIENALDKVKSLTGVEFDWKPEHKEAHGYEGHDTGIIAQQVQAVMPSAVRTNETGFLAVRYEKLIGLLVEANKELAARVEELEKKLG